MCVGSFGDLPSFLSPYVSSVRTSSNEKENPQVRLICDLIRRRLVFSSSFGSELDSKFSMPKGRGFGRDEERGSWRKRMRERASSVDRRSGRHGRKSISGRLIRKRSESWAQIDDGPGLKRA